MVAILFVKSRLNFCLPDGTRVAHNCGAPSALIAYSEYDAEKLRSSGIAGALVPKARMLCKDGMAAHVRMIEERLALLDWPPAALSCSGTGPVAPNFRSRKT
jgi:hypothetical protein